MAQQQQADEVLAEVSRNPFNFEETSVRDSSYDPDSMFRPFNPDDIVQKHQDYSIYKSMLQDDQVSVCLQIKKDLILSSGFDIIAKEDDQEEMVDFLTVALSEDPEKPLESILEEICSAYEFGFSLSEKIFKLNKESMLTLKDIKTRYPGSWLIHTDDQGNVSRYEQRTSRSNIDVPPENLIHYINNEKFQNPYGTSDLRAAYQAWFTKKHITRWYAIFIEKAASAIPIGKYKSQANKATIQAVYDRLKAFQTKSALVIPDYFEVDFLEAKSNGDAFIRGINLFNMFIGRSLLIPDLLGFQGDETSGGSYSLGQSQMEVFFKHIRRRRCVLERVINNEIIWPMVLFNWGNIDNYPKFRFRDITQDEINNTVKLWLEAIKNPSYRPTPEEIDHFRSIINFPITENEGLEDEEIEEDPDALAPEEPNEENTEIDIIPTNDGSFARKFQPPQGSFANKTDMKLIENQLDTSLGGFLALGNSAIDEMFEKFIDSIDTKKIVQKERVDKLDALSLKGVGSLGVKLKKALFDLYKKSKEIAATEIFKSNFAKPKVSEEFLKILEAETGQFIGDWEHNVTKGARLAIIQAIKDGESISRVVDIIEKDKSKAKVALERFSRTKFTEVMNKGRVAFFEETKAVDGYQYSAVLDDRTTDICRGLHGKKFKKGTQPIPPMHFNCRSVLIPITIFETFTPDEKIGKTPIDQFIEEKKGVGFPKQ